MLKGHVYLNTSSAIRIKTAFSAPEPNALHYCDHALSVIRPSSLTFHMSDFLSTIVLYAISQ